MGSLPEEEARYHLKRCIDSGLWVANAQDANKKNENTASKETEDETYEEVADK